jgi:ferredoxin
VTDPLPDEIDLDAYRREGLIDPPATEGEQHHDATGRVQLSFSPAGRSVRVPAGVTVFDAASWNGIAIDSTCGGHGTCKKCKVQVLSGDVPVSGWTDARSRPTSSGRAGGWRASPWRTATCGSRCRR